MTDLERCARAIYAAGNWPAQWGTNQHAMNAAYKMARAVLEALKTPSEGMKEVAMRAVFDGTQSDIRDQTIYETSAFGAAFRAMLNHILKEK